MKASGARGCFLERERVAVVNAAATGGTVFLFEMPVGGDSTSAVLGSLDERAWRPWEDAHGVTTLGQ